MFVHVLMWFNFLFGLKNKIKNQNNTCIDLKYAMIFFGYGLQHLEYAFMQIYCTHEATCRPKCFVIKLCAKGNDHEFTCKVDNISSLS